MDVDELPPPEELWWPFAVRAALDQARGGEQWRFEPHHQLLRYDGPDGTLLRLQRLYDGRFVWWGVQPDASHQIGWTGIPGWATSDAVHSWFTGAGATFVAWHARDGWDTATPEADLATPARLLLEPDVSAALVAAAETGDEEALGEVLDVDAAQMTKVLATLRAIREIGPPAPQGRVRAMLISEIRAQMAETAERDRMLPQRPVMLVRWVRAASPPPRFSFGMHLQADGLEPALGNSAILDQFRRSLINVFERLHAEESAADSGSWLFARLEYDGSMLTFDRAFDGRPGWYEDDGPSMDTLAAEMARRTPPWRPAWSRLLP